MRVCVRLSVFVCVCVCALACSHCFLLAICKWPWLGPGATIGVGVRVRVRVQLLSTTRRVFACYKYFQFCLWLSNNLHIIASTHTSTHFIFFSLLHTGATLRECEFNAFHLRLFITEIAKLLNLVQLFLLLFFSPSMLALCSLFSLATWILRTCCCVVVVVVVVVAIAVVVVAAVAFIAQRVKVCYEICFAFAGAVEMLYELSEK